MYSLLVVDDEKYAIEAVAKGIDWSDIDIDQVYSACCAVDAIEIFENNKIDVMICDIEMPGKNGIQLLEWVKENSPLTETIFLTGHANFNYAQRSVQLGSFNYLLKPVDYEELKNVVKEALEKVNMSNEISEFYAIYKKYYKNWENHIPIIIERFWQDILSERLPISPERLKSIFTMYGIPLKPDSLLIPILVSPEEWSDQLDTKDEEVMEFGLRNIAEELFLDQLSGAVIQDYEGNNVILVYCTNSSLPQNNIIKNIAEKFVKACNDYLKCSISCYIGEPVKVDRLADSYNSLLDMERANVLCLNTVFFENQLKMKSSGQYHSPSTLDWTVLMEAGKKEELLYKMEDTFKNIPESELTYETLETFYYGLLNSIYVILHKKGLSVRRVFSEKQSLLSCPCPRSVSQFMKWANEAVSVAVDFMEETGNNVSAIINKVQTYISNHIYEEFTREDLAAHVYINSAYLSRIFKKETGTSLTDYILNLRMEKAKLLLSETNQKISDISGSLGYNSYTHFTKMFKRVVGITPQEYRRKFFIAN